MAVFKCKMCGASLEPSDGVTTMTCDYCGSSQTLPKISDDKIERLYERANHYRRNDEFDKAMAIYEQILNENPEDAESYWSIVLCKYGIEYVEDPKTRKRVPTINRTQMTSVFDDDNYKSALKYADISQRVIYQDEAKTINDIQKRILDISRREEPFDVFICYKETDSNGRRTHDSVYANELYHELTREGFKVFFARITLEDKLGTAYEPYIFSALNSSKVMVVLGTRAEYFNAVWVKNEWSRFLTMMKNGERKTLIPAYKDMDPYDLPEEFSHLQALDMSKLGFMPDLVRGIEKIVGYEKVKAGASVQSRMNNTDTYIQAQRVEEMVTPTPIVEEKEPMPDPEPLFEHNTLYDVRFRSFGPNKNKTINLLKERLGFEWNQASLFVEGKKPLIIKGLYKSEANYIVQTFEKVGCVLQMDLAEVENNLKGPLKYREYKLNMVSFSNQKYKCRDFIMDVTEKNWDQAWSALLGKTPILDRVSLKEALRMKDLFAGSGFIVGVEEINIDPASKKFGNKAKIEELEKEKMTNLILAIVLLLFFWPASIFFFIKMGQLQQEIDKLKKK